MSTRRLTASCSCGAVEIEAVGRPIVAVVCYCDDCQSAARQIEAMPGASPFRQSDGGTPLIAYRKDRVRYVRGSHLLKKLKLREGSATNRRLAMCCNSVMVLDFDDRKHWIDIYRARMRGDTPAPEMRVCARGEIKGFAEPKNMPTYRGYPARFIAKLVAARLAMVLSR
jgi:hypothetical protein